MLATPSLAIVHGCPSDRRGWVRGGQSLRHLLASGAPCHWGHRLLSVWLWSQHCGPLPGRCPSALSRGAGLARRPRACLCPSCGRSGQSSIPPVPGVWPPPACSDLGLQVDDVLAHQRDGGARLLPLHTPQLQGRRWQRLQLLLHPRGRPVGFPEALPGPLVGRLLLFWLLASGQWTGGAGRQAGREQRMQSESEQQEGTREGSRGPARGGQEQSLSLHEGGGPHWVWVWGGLQGRAAGGPCLLSTPCLAVPS